MARKRARKRAPTPMAPPAKSKVSGLVLAGLGAIGSVAGAAAGKTIAAKAGMSGLFLNPPTGLKNWLFKARTKYHDWLSGVGGKAQGYEVVLHKDGRETCGGQFATRRNAEAFMAMKEGQGYGATLWMNSSSPKGTVKVQYPSLLNSLYFSALVTPPKGMVAANPYMRPRPRPLPAAVRRARSAKVARAMGTNPYSRTRVASPKEFDPRSFRTISPGSGRHKLVVGCPKGFYRGGKCSKGMEVQSVLTKRNPEVDKIMAYEQGELSAAETVRLFASLIKSGTVWQLQGHYGRTAARLIEAGYISPQGKVLKQVAEVNPGKNWHIRNKRWYARMSKEADNEKSRSYFEGKTAAHRDSVNAIKAGVKDNPLLMVVPNPSREAAARKILGGRGQLRCGCMNVESNPRGGDDMGTLTKDPEFKKAVALYKKFHGCEPKGFKRVLLPTGPKMGLTLMKRFLDDIFSEVKGVPDKKWLMTAAASHLARYSKRHGHYMSRPTAEAVVAAWAKDRFGVSWNPGRAYHQREAKRYGKLLKGDRKAGHQAAAKYWQGALSAEAAAAAVSKNPRTHYRSGHEIRLKETGCDGCSPSMINGKLCHETGCPYAWRDHPVKCFDCGCDFYPETKGQTRCGCMNVESNPRGGDDMGTLTKDPEFKKAVALYRKFHGCEPKSFKRVLLPTGSKKKVDGRGFFVSLGKAPAESYLPPARSRKAGSIFVHKFEGKQPEKVVSADGKLIVTLPGHHRVTDWIRG